MKKVSVVIPVYNVESYLPKCLSSVSHQTYENLEIICVDDGTPDNSVKIIKAWQEKDKRIKLVSQKNQGLSSARNTGIDESTGDYIIFLDSDDWIDEITCATAVDAAEKNSADAVMWNYVREFSEKSIEKNIFESDMVFDEKQTKNLIHRRIAGLLGDELSSPENADSIVTAWGKLYKADIIKDNNIKFTDTKIIGTEDALFNLYYFKYVKKSVFINKPFNHYRKDNDTSLTKKYKPDLYSQWSELYKRMGEYIDNNKLGEDFKTALSNRICLSIIGLGLNELCNSQKLAEDNLKRILSSKLYIDAYKKLELKYFPIHWKFFFFCCKHRLVFGVMLMLKIINNMIGK